MRSQGEPFRARTRYGRSRSAERRGLIVAPLLSQSGAAVLVFSQSVQYAVSHLAGIREEYMAVRLVVSITAAPGKGAEFAQAFKGRCEESRKDPGCQEFEIFQSVLNPDKFALLELWDSPEALANHAKLQAARPPLPEGLRQGAGEREDYEYKRTR
jgi:quinol monooxygenase YgiN